MAKIGSQNRLLIPRELTDLLKLSGKIGVFWDAEEKKIYLSNVENCEQEYCIGIRSIDAKNRIILSEHIIKLIKANRKSEIIVAVKNHRIYIFKSDEEIET